MKLEDLTPARAPAVEFDRDWDRLPMDELNRLDEICDRFEQTLGGDLETRIESLLVGLAEPQQRLLVRELVRLQVERRNASGHSSAPDEYASRFPQWADELQTLVTQGRQNHDEQQLAASARADTIDERSSVGKDTKTNLAESPASRSAEWRAASSGLAWAELPADGVLGHYQLQRVLGRGGMGVVVRAYDSRLARQVAIKILAP